jgi:lysophosphatidic acid acyltransferase/lysophosphatidylinositol acyltransferase
MDSLSSIIFMTFVLSGIVINIVQLCLFILIGWWHRSLFRKLNYYLVWMIYSQLLFLVDWWSNSEIRMYVDPEVLEEIGSENAVILANHHYELDWLFGWMVADRAACLGNARE